MKHADILNDDVLSVIFTFIPHFIKRKLNRAFHQKSAPPPISRMHTFLRTIIRNDYAFIFNYRLKLHYKQWRKIHPWIYKNMKFHNYIEYLRYLCCVYKSERCKNKLNALENELKPNVKKKYKKMKIRNIRWSN